MAENNLGNTQYFRTKPDQELQVKEVLDLVYNAMDEKGYNPVSISRTSPGNGNMRVLGLDYGSKTVGVAVSDPLGLTAQGVETVWRKQENKLRRTLARIEEIISEYQVTEIVLTAPWKRPACIRKTASSIWIR